MYAYKKMLEYPINNIKRKDVNFARFLVTALGGAAGEISASIRYMQQRYTMPDERGKSLLTDIATEELAHVEIVSSLINALIRDASEKEIEENGLGTWLAEHGKGIYPMNADGVPHTMAYIAVTGDPIVDLTEDMAAEEKARASYENLMKLTTDENILQVLAFLRQREVVHYTRFKELLEIYKNMKL